MTLQASDIYCENGWWQSRESKGLQVGAEPLDRYGNYFKITVSGGSSLIVDRLALSDNKKRLKFIENHGETLNGLHEPVREMLDILAAKPFRELQRALESAHEAVEVPNFEPVAFDEFIARENVPIECVVEGLIRPKRISFLTGPANSGKTWLAYDLALAVAMGGRWMTYFPTSQGKVLLIQEDDDEQLARVRLRDLLPMRGPRGELPIQLAVQQRVRADVPASWNQVLEVLREDDYKLLIVDAMSNMHHQDENSEAAMKPVLEVFDEAAALGPAVLVLHHHRKGAGGRDSMRGTSLIRDRADTVLNVTATPNGCTVEVNKLKFAATPAPFRVNINGTDGLMAVHYIGEVTSPESASTTARARILVTLAGRTEETAMTAAEITAAIPDLGESRIKRELKSLRDQQAVSSKIGARGAYSYWAGEAAAAPIGVVAPSPMTEQVVS